MNLPIGIATGVLALRVVPRDRGTGLGQGAAGLVAVAGTVLRPGD